MSVFIEGRWFGSSEEMARTIFQLELELKETKLEKALLHERVEELEGLVSTLQPPAHKYLGESVVDMLNSDYESLKADATKWRNCQSGENWRVCEHVLEARQQKELGGQFISDEEYERLQAKAANWDRYGCAGKDDAELGALVRKMPRGMALWHGQYTRDSEGWHISKIAGDDQSPRFTPEEALRAAGIE